MEKKTNTTSKKEKTIKVNKTNDIKLCDLSISELNEYMDAIKEICRKYEQKSMMNVGAYDDMAKKEMEKSNNILHKYQEIYNNILLEMENKVKNLF